MTQPTNKPGGVTPIRSRSSASTGDGDVKIHRAKIINVNTRDYTVDVVYETYPYSSHFDIPWMTPYTHQNQGEGVAIMPEPDSTVWVCQPSESGKDAFVIGWMPVQESGTYRAGRQLLNPGDINLTTRDGNFVTIRRGGIVQIGATPICQRIYIPIRNIIRDFAENYELSTPAGDLTWEVLRSEESGDGHQACLLTLECKEFSDDPNKDPIAILKIGSHGDGIDTIITVETRDKGGGSVMSTLTIDKSGNLKYTNKGNITITSTGGLSVSMDQIVSIKSIQNMTYQTSAAMSLSGAQVSISGSGASLNLNGVALLNGLSVLLGDGLFPVVVDNGTLMAWIQAVTALLNGPVGVPATKAILPPPFIWSTRVKA